MYLSVNPRRGPPKRGDSKILKFMDFRSSVERLLLHRARLGSNSLQVTGLLCRDPSRGRSFKPRFPASPLPPRLFFLAPLPRSPASPTSERYHLVRHPRSGIASVARGQVVGVYVIGQGRNYKKGMRDTGGSLDLGLVSGGRTVGRTTATKDGDFSTL